MIASASMLIGLGSTVSAVASILSDLRPMGIQKLSHFGSLRGCWQTCCARVGAPSVSTSYRCGHSFVAARRWRLKLMGSGHYQTLGASC